MSTDTGRAHPSDRATRPTDQAPAGLGDTASVPCAEERDYSAPPETEFEGREFTAEITFCLDVEATDAQIREWLEWELGGGSIACDHPLEAKSQDLSRVTVTYLRRTGRSRFIDWDEASKDGSRSGKVRIEFDERGQ